MYTTLTEASSGKPKADDKNKMRKRKGKNQWVTSLEKEMWEVFPLAWCTTPISVQEAMSIPEEKAAVDRAWGEAEKDCRLGTKVRPKTDVIERAKKDGPTVYVANLMDLCHLRNAELARHLRKYQGRVVLQRKTVSKMKTNTDPHSQSKALQLHRWQRQICWTQFPDFMV